MHNSLAALLALGLLAPTLHAVPTQDVFWASFERSDSVLVGPADQGLQDMSFKDYAAADLDLDGDEDLVIVRRTDMVTEGRISNVLYMNVDGLLENQTAQFAANSDVPGDSGFLTPTADSRVVIADIDVDGWPDVITACSNAEIGPKDITHPRIYRNLGEDAQGNWLGLRYESSRIPALPGSPSFLAFGVGDLTGNGLPDIILGLFRKPTLSPLNREVLLINDGTGHFQDETVTRMGGNAIQPGLMGSCFVEDFNQDGWNDILVNRSNSQQNRLVAVIPQVPLASTFNQVQGVQLLGTSPYFAGTGDLNNDSLPDIIVGQTGHDGYVLNEGPGFALQTEFSNYVFFENYDDLGDSGDMVLADLDNDGWDDIIVCDVDVLLPECDRSLRVVHHRGIVNGQPSLYREEGSGFDGAEGLLTTELTGVHDVAVLDIDGDGDKDMVVGRCVGTSVYLNNLIPQGLGEIYCSPNALNSTGQPGAIATSGSPSVTMNDFALMASDLPLDQFAYFFVGDASASIQNPGGLLGTLCVGGTLGRFSDPVEFTGQTGSISTEVDLSALPTQPMQAVQPGDTWFFQAIYRDNIGGPVALFTDAVSVTFE